MPASLYQTDADGLITIVILFAYRPQRVRRRPGWALRAWQARRR